MSTLMFGLRPVARIQASRPWLYREPLRTLSQNKRATLASLASVAARPKRRTGLKIFATAVVLGTGFVAFTDTGKFYYGLAQRSGRVLITLAICINDYRVTLPKYYKYPREEYSIILRECHQRCADRTLKTMEQNGSVYIKLGQHLTSLNYLLPNEWCDTFIPLQDHCPVSSFESVKAMVEKDSGMAFEDIFSEFEEVPIGAASLAQVHRAVLRENGQKVALKIQHPELDETAELDLRMTKFTFNTLKRVFPDYDLTWLSNELALSLPQELDFRLEGQNATEAREYFSHLKRMPLIIPEVYNAQRRFLVMQYISGHRIDDLNYLDSNNISRDEVSASLARIFNTMIFSPKAPLHCDPHGGNIAINVNNSRRYPYNFDIVLYDHGLYRHIPKDLQRSYAKLWLAVLDADEKNMRKYAYEVGGITDEQFPLFASAITGRDYSVVTQSVARIPRTKGEKLVISNALGDGMLIEIFQLLSKLPRIILLILKTNDLTRSLDTALETQSGPVRTFLILARYAARTVYDEQMELLRASGGLLWPPDKAGEFFAAWVGYTRINIKLEVVEWYLWFRGLIGLKKVSIL